MGFMGCIPIYSEISWMDICSLTRDMSIPYLRQSYLNLFVKKSYRRKCFVA